MQIMSFISVIARWNIRIKTWCVLRCRVNKHFQNKGLTYLKNKKVRPCLFILKNYLDRFQRNVGMTPRSVSRRRLWSCDGNTTRYIHRKYWYHLQRLDYGRLWGCFVVVTAVACVEPLAHGRPARPNRSRACATQTVVWVNRLIRV